MTPELDPGSDFAYLGGPGSPMRATLTSLEYSNLLTGGPAMATLGCLLQGLPPAPGPGRAGKLQARSSWWPVAPGR